MPYKAKSDLTKAAIKKSFLELLNEKTINQISVSDIAEGCGFNRNTIYYHYDDIPCLVEEIVIDTAEKIISEYTDYHSLEACLEKMAVFALEHKRIVLNIYNSSNRSVYELYLMKVCGSVVENYLHTVFGDIQADPESREILVRFYKCESFGQIIDWLNCAMNYNVCEQFSKLCRRHAKADDGGSWRNRRKRVYLHKNRSFDKIDHGRSKCKLLRRKR